MLSHNVNRDFAICYTVGSLEEAFIDFYHTRAWTHCIRGSTPTNPSESGNEGTNKDSTNHGQIPTPGITCLYADISTPLCVELMKKYALKAELKISGEGTIPPIENVDFQIKRHGTNDRWLSIEEVSGRPGPGVLCAKTAVSPGFFDFRAVITAQGQSYTSYETVLEIMYPSIDKFKDLPIIKTRSMELWNKTVEYSTIHKATRETCEYGCFIYLNTATGMYRCGADIQGTPVILDRAVTGTVIFNYSEKFFDPRETCEVEVGTLHSHYPLTWAITTLFRNSGPSKDDIGNELPGIVYDYTKTVNGGDPVDIKNNPLIPYTYGQQRRPTTDYKR